MSNKDPRAVPGNTFRGGYPDVESLPKEGSPGYYVLLLPNHFYEWNVEEDRYLYCFSATASLQNPSYFPEMPEIAELGENGIVYREEWVRWYCQVTGGTEKEAMTKASQITENITSVRAKALKVLLDKVHLSANAHVGKTLEFNSKEGSRLPNDPKFNTFQNRVYPANKETDK